MPGVIPRLAALASFQTELLASAVPDT